MNKLIIMMIKDNLPQMKFRQIVTIINILIRIKETLLLIKVNNNNSNNNNHNSNKKEK